MEKWVNPVTEVQQFAANEYVATCYYLVCSSPRASLYYGLGAPADVCPEGHAGKEHKVGAAEFNTGVPVYWWGSIFTGDWAGAMYGGNHFIRGVDDPNRIPGIPDETNTLKS